MIQENGLLPRRYATNAAGSTSTQKMRQRRETVGHPFGTIKMVATHFLMKTLLRVATEMAPHVPAYNLTRVMYIVDVQPLMSAIHRSPSIHGRLLLQNRPGTAGILI